MAYTIEELLAEVFEAALLSHVPEGVEEQAEYYAALSALMDACKRRQAQMRDGLLASAGEGTETASGQSLKLRDVTIARQERVAKTPDAEGMKQLLQQNGMEVNDAFDVVKTLALNPSKVDFLVEIGQLDFRQVEGLKRRSTALKVTPKANTKARIKALIEALCE